MKKIILASTSTVYGGDFLAYLLPQLKVFFKDIKTLTFIPFARPSGITYDDYTEKARQAFAKIGISVIGIHQTDNYIETIKNAEAIFTGGGNTFELLNQLYKNNLIEPLRAKILSGMPYLGTSAGSNICGQNIKTTNDMPVVYPPTFEALGVVPFNINPHYLDADPKSKHMGETRETRIKEYLIYNDTPVVGLREGSWLEINGNQINLCGEHSARVFKNDSIKEMKTIDF